MGGEIGAAIFAPECAQIGTTRGVELLERVQIGYVWKIDHVRYLVTGPNEAETRRMQKLTGLVVGTRGA